MSKQDSTPSAENEHDDKPKKKSISSDSSITISVKDAVAIISFTLYVGGSIAGLMYANSKLDALSDDNKKIQEKIEHLNLDSNSNAIKLSNIEAKLEELSDNVKDRLFGDRKESKK